MVALLAWRTKDLVVCFAVLRMMFENIFNFCTLFYYFLVLFVFVCWKIVHCSVVEYVERRCQQLDVQA